MNFPKVPNENYVVVQGVFDTEVGPDDTGSKVVIYKDKPCIVGKQFVPFVLAAGGNVLEEDGSVDESVELPGVPEEQTQTERLIEVCQELIVTNEVRNFTRTGRPRIEAVRAMVDFPVTTEQLRDAYEAAVTGTDDGDNSTEHPTESVDPTDGRSERSVDEE